LFHFLGLSPTSIGSGGKIQVSSPSRDYSGSILPEAHSHFEEGYKIVTFYADPEALLKTAYVLRKDGWRDSLNLYQRMISKAKIEAIRIYLKKEKRVFINNIIVTLPPEVKPLNSKLETIDTAKLTQTAPVAIRLPDAPNSIGIIDGQHRVFAYHETVNDDAEIAQLRVQQNLLVTGIIYPEGLSSFDREKFEARLFLEINSTQTNAKSQLKQAIGVVLDPFSTESIAARVLAQLGKTGPLAGQIEQYFFDKNKLKTASIVSYGLKPLVKTSGTDSLFAIWSDPRKAELAEGGNSDALQDYITFCVYMINRVLIAIRKNLAGGRWTTDAKVPGRVLATTYVNSFLITLRLLIEQGKPIGEKDLSNGFVGIDTFDFAAYHSSQYKRMAEKIVEKLFASLQAAPVVPSATASS
jgi:DGQHR domain-containing protein